MGGRHVPPSSAVAVVGALGVAALSESSASPVERE